MLRVRARVDLLPNPQGKNRSHQFDDRAADVPVRLAGLPGGSQVVHFIRDEYLRLRPRPIPRPPPG